jgi:hypothetical protein
MLLAFLAIPSADGGISLVWRTNYFPRSRRVCRNRFSCQSSARPIGDVNHNFDTIYGFSPPFLGTDAVWSSKYILWHSPLEQAYHSQSLALVSL